MFLNAILLFLLFSVGSADRLRFHLENLVDRDIYPCDDFYHHVCSQKADPNEFFMSQVATLFKEAMTRLIPKAAMTSPITYDLNYMLAHADTEEDNNYANLARQRCGDNVDCYIEDQQYYANITLELYRNIQVPITDILPTDSQEEKINKYIDDTSATINKIIPYARFNNGSMSSMNLASSFFAKPLEFIEILQTRLHMIDFVESNSTYNDFHNITDFVDNMKKRMIQYIEKSSWLQNDEIGQVILEKINERIANITVFHDFDEVDRNLTTLQKIHRDFIDLYFAQKRKTGVHGLDTLVSLKDAFSAFVDEEQINDPTEADIFIKRIRDNFQFNAFYVGGNLNMATMLAPFMYRPASNSDILKEPFLTLAALGHELYHSLFLPSSKILLDLYGHRSECIEKHYSDTCKVFAMGACASGKQTITEDASDLEAYRLIHSLFQDKYDEQARNTRIDGMETTLEQALFYFISMTWCEEDYNRTSWDVDYDIHSYGNIRINAALSLMPEFTKAFSCKAGDQMYVEKENSCYVFGPDSK